MRYRLVRYRLVSQGFMAGVVILAALALAAACGGPTVDSGIEGDVRIGPLAPIDQPGVDNTAPYSARLTVKAIPDRNVLAESTSGADGRFRIFLAPGEYVLEPEQGSPFPVAASLGFTVVEGRFTQVTVDYDSGIR